MFDKRISIFTGHFGSGKTEVAVNYAIATKQKYEKTAIVDLDIVNPFFRTADAAEEMRKMGIKVLLPVYANTNVDVPSLPPEINSLFEDKSYKVILDIGGDDLGAKAVSRYRSEIENDEYAMFFVINTRRPLTDTPEKIGAIMAEIEESANIKISALINNTNLLGDTKAKDVLEGYDVISKVSEAKSIPIAFSCFIGEDEDELDKLTGLNIFKMKKHILLPWDRQ